MIVQGIVSAKTTINKKEYEFTFPNGADIKDVTQALADMHKTLVDMVQEQNDKAQKDAEAKKESVKEDSGSEDV